MGKTKVFFKKIRITKGTCHAKMGTCHAKMGTIKEKNGMDITRSVEGRLSRLCIREGQQAEFRALDAQQ